MRPSSLSHTLSRNLVFVHGKGGVGKTVVSQAIAHRLASQGSRTLWVTFEDPTLPTGQIKPEAPSLWSLNADFTFSFEEYVGIKIGAPKLTHFFLQNKAIRYLAKVAPGIQELVLLGKVWHECNHYQHVVVDLPATGHGLTMFQSTENFARLFRGGPLQKDAEAMLQSFQDAEKVGHLIVALPEEMPLRESLDLNDYLSRVFPNNPASFVVNRLFPEEDPKEDSLAESLGDPATWKSPLSESAADYVRKRLWLENYNLKIWEEANIPYEKLDYVPPPLDSTQSAIVKGLAEQLQARSYL